MVRQFMAALKWMRWIWEIYSVTMVCFDSTSFQLHRNPTFLLKGSQRWNVVEIVRERIRSAVFLLAIIAPTSRFKYLRPHKIPWYSFDIQHPHLLQLFSSIFIHWWWNEKKKKLLSVGTPEYAHTVVTRTQSYRNKVPWDQSTLGWRNHLSGNAQNCRRNAASDHLRALAS